MERTNTFIIGACTFQRHHPSNHINDVDLAFQVINCGIAKRQTHLYTPIY